MSRVVHHGTMAGAQPTTRLVDLIYTSKPITTVRFHKRQKFVLCIMKLSRNSHLHTAAAALWDTGAAGSNRTGNKEHGNSAYGPTLTLGCCRSSASGAVQHSFAP